DWDPGNHQYAVAADGTVCAAYLIGGRWQIIQGRDTKSAKLIGKPVELVSAIHAWKDGFVAMVGRPDRTMAIMGISATGEIWELYAPKMRELPENTVSVAREIQFPTEDGSKGFAWYYAPQNAEFEGPAGEKPPLMVFAHGGPTAQAFSYFQK